MLNANVSQNTSADFSSDLDVGAADYPLRLNVNIPLKDGTGANQANQAWSDTRTLGASASETLDFFGGGLLDAFGVELDLVNIKSITITADADNTNNVEVQRPAANGVPLFLAAGDGVSLTPGSAITMTFPDVDGIPVTDATGDLLDFTNSAAVTGVNYTIVVVGVQ